MRNELYIALGCPSDWRAEVKLSVKGEVAVIADALYTKAGAYHIVEIDNMQSMSDNRAKINKYRRLFEIVSFEKEPQFYWLTTTEYRRNQLARLCEGLNARVYTVADLK